MEWDPNSSEDDTSLENVHIDNNIAGDQEWFDPIGNQPNITDFTSVYGVDINNCRIVSMWKTFICC